MFIDRIRIKVIGGKGGDGCVSFHREKFVPLGGPDGGNGGRGGDVIFYVEPGENTLVSLHSRPWYAAEPGGNGSTNNKTGADGECIRLPVPPGTTVSDSVTGELICDLVDETQEAVVAAGGRGGKGNAHFATPVHQTPRRAEPGKPGVERNLLVELKVVADIGIVGFPNAGKSTLLNAITKARARIGDYPFTTLHPVLGTLELDLAEEAQLLHIRNEKGIQSKIRPRIILADIPGILEGAHQGVGLGLEFLRHIERTKVLLFVLDVSIHREHEPVNAYQALIHEIASYNPDLLLKPRLIALNKVDDPLDEGEIPEIVQSLQRCFESESPRPQPGTIFPVSSLMRTGLEPLCTALFEAIRDILKAMPSSMDSSNILS